MYYIYATCKYNNSCMHIHNKISHYNYPILELVADHNVLSKPYRLLFHNNFHSNLYTNFQDGHLHHKILNNSYLLKSCYKIVHLSLIHNLKQKEVLIYFVLYISQFYFLFSSNSSYNSIISSTIECL